MVTRTVDSSITEKILLNTDGGIDTANIFSVFVTTSLLVRRDNQGENLDHSVTPCLLILDIQVLVLLLTVHPAGQGGGWE